MMQQLTAKETGDIQAIYGILQCVDKATELTREAYYDKFKNQFDFLSNRLKEKYNFSDEEIMNIVSLKTTLL